MKEIKNRIKCFVPIDKVDVAEYVRSLNHRGILVY